MMNNRTLKTFLKAKCPFIFRGCIFILLSLSKSFNSELMAQNPLFQGYSDPAMYVENGKMYMVVGKDEDPKNKNFIMPYWTIFSSTDLMNWKLETNIDPKDTYLGANYKYCWAADMTVQNGKYYFYYSNHGLETGVLEAQKPEGPYIDVLKKAIVPKEYSANFEYDPTVFTDDDGQKYLIFGRDGQLGKNILHYQIAKLDSTMLGLAEKSHDLLTDQRFGFGTEKAARDHSYFHKYNGIYYLSCAGIYMTSKNVYGPYSNPRNCGQDKGHASFAEYNGQTYHAWEWTCEPFGNRTYRQVMMTYLHYKDNGNMVSDPNFLQAGKHYTYGVGNYSAKMDTIQAEWYFNKSTSVLKKDTQEDGFEIQNLQNNDFLNFPNVKDVKANAKINFHVSAKTKGAKIEIRKDNPTGTLLGTCNIPNTKSFKTYQTVSSLLKNGTGTQNLYFVFKGGKGDLVHLDWFKFDSGSEI